MRGEDELLKIEVFCKIRNLNAGRGEAKRLPDTSTVALQEIERQDLEPSELSASGASGYTKLRSRLRFHAIANRK
jgi:hypothetical protein